MEATQSKRIELLVTQLDDLPRVRAAVRGLAERLAVPAGDVVLVVNELVTNALLYSPGPCGLRGWIPESSAALRVEVIDPLPVALPPVTPRASSAVGGRGLVIVDLLVPRWGVELQAPVGKVVWFEIDLLT